VKYKYNVTYKKSGKSMIKNFKTKQKMIDTLVKDGAKYSKLDNVIVNFGPIALPIKHTVWYVTTV